MVFVRIEFSFFDDLFNKKIINYNCIRNNGIISFVIGKINWFGRFFKISFNLINKPHNKIILIVLNNNRSMQ